MDSHTTWTKFRVADQVVADRYTQSTGTGTRGSTESKTESHYNRFGTGSMPAAMGSSAAHSMRSAATFALTSTVTVSQQSNGTTSLTQLGIFAGESYNLSSTISDRNAHAVVTYAESSTGTSSSLQTTYDSTSNSNNSYSQGAVTWSRTEDSRSSSTNLEGSTTTVQQATNERTYQAGSWAEGNYNLSSVNYSSDSVTTLTSRASKSDTFTGSETVVNASDFSTNQTTISPPRRSRARAAAARGTPASTTSPPRPGRRRP